MLNWDEQLKPALQTPNLNASAAFTQGHVQSTDRSTVATSTATTTEQRRVNAADKRIIN